MNELQAVQVFRVACLECGDVRLLLHDDEAAPSTCPRCARDAEVLQLGRGATIRPLPYVEVLERPLRPDEKHDGVKFAEPKSYRVLVD